MLILTRRVGQTLYIGDRIRVSLRDKTRFHAVVAVSAPAELTAEWDGHPLRPARLPQGSATYLVPLLSGQSFRIGEAVVWARFYTGPGQSRYRERAVRFRIGAPRCIDVHREEVLTRIRASQTVDAVPEHSPPSEASSAGSWMSWECAA